MPNRYFAGNSLAAFSRTHSSIVETTTAGRFNSSYVSSGILVPLGNITTTTFAATGTIYVRFDVYLGSASTGAVLVTLLNGTTNAYRVKNQAGSVWSLDYWNGSSWVSIGSTVSWLTYNGTRITAMLKVVMGTSMELFVGGSSILSASGMSGHQTTVTKAQFSEQGSSTVYSQVMIADYDLRDSNYMPAALSGDSATNASGTGTVSDVNETVLVDTTVVNLSTSGHKRGFTQSSITVPSGQTIAASVVSARGRATGTITDGKLGIRVGGANYSSSGKSYGTGFEPRQRIDELNPSTSAPYTQSGFNGIETYVEAA